MDADPTAGWEPVDLGAVGRLPCPPGWRRDETGAGENAGAAVAPDDKARLVAHTVVQQAAPDHADFAARVEAAAERVLAHLLERPGVETPQVLTVSGAAQPILEIGAVFFDDPVRPRLRIRQWHALAPLDREAERQAIIAFSLLTPALSTVSETESLAESTAGAAGDPPVSHPSRVYSPSY